MAVYNGPPRGGSRGGRDQFNWCGSKLYLVRVSGTAVFVLKLIHVPHEHLDTLGARNREDVKGDKEREYYLGHSVKALAGRWQKGVSGCSQQASLVS